MSLSVNGNLCAVTYDPNYICIFVNIISFHYIVSFHFLSLQYFGLNHSNRPRTRFRDLLKYMQLDC